MRTLCFCAVLLAAIPTAAAAQQTPAEAVAPSLLPEKEWRRFLASAVMLQSADSKTLVLYDFATRCAALADPASPGTLRWASSRASANPFGLGHLVNEGHDDLQAFLSGEDNGPGNCGEAVGRAYGADFDATAAAVGSIARHSIAVLRGGEIDGADATASPPDIDAANSARDRTTSKIDNPVLLGFRRAQDRIVLIMGEPDNTARWFAQYQSTASGWRFEGAYDAPYLP